MYFFCGICLILFLVPGLQKPQFRFLRGTAFVICGLLNCIPILHMEINTEQRYLHDFSTFPWALGGGLYIFGAVLYMFKVPERFCPGRFDIFVSLNSPNKSLGLLSSNLSLLDRGCVTRALLREFEQFSRETDTLVPE